MATEAVSYGVKFPARTLRALPASSSEGRSQWVVGTTSLREENEVRVLEYDAANDRLNTVVSWVHPEEVWDIACCPGQPQALLTVHSKVGVYATTIWQGSNTELVPVSQLKHDGIIRRALWGVTDASRAMTVEEGALRLWDLAGGAAQQAATAAVPGELGAFWTAALHPSSRSMALAAGGSSIQLWDLANMSSTAVVQGAHKLPVRDVSWAPNNEYRFVTGGDDGKLRFWDTRLLQQPEALLELSGHSHWVWQVAYSPFHDPLLLSSSTDTTVCVWFTPALAKAKGVEAKASPSRPIGGGARQDSSDGKVHTFDEHEDSVYGLAWSSVDPWLFASMSHDGRLVVNKVPKNIKYKILI